MDQFERLHELPIDVAKMILQDNPVAIEALSGVPKFKQLIESIKKDNSIWVPHILEKMSPFLVKNALLESGIQDYYSFYKLLEEGLGPIDTALRLAEEKKIKELTFYIKNTGVDMDKLFEISLNDAEMFRMMSIAYSNAPYEFASVDSILDEVFIKNSDEHISILYNHLMEKENLHKEFLENSIETKQYKWIERLFRDRGEFFYDITNMSRRDIIFKFFNKKIYEIASQYPFRYAGTPIDTFNNLSREASYWGFRFMADKGLLDMEKETRSDGLSLRAANGETEKFRLLFPYASEEIKEHLFQTAILYHNYIIASDIFPDRKIERIYKLQAAEYYVSSHGHYSVTLKHVINGETDAVLNDVAKHYEYIGFDQNDGELLREAIENGFMDIARYLYKISQLK